MIASQHNTSDIVAGIAGAVVLAPPALLNRAARYLEAAAALVRDAGVLPDGFDPGHAAQLAGTFDADALAMRYYSAPGHHRAEARCQSDASRMPAQGPPGSLAPTTRSIRQSA